MPINSVYIQVIRYRITSSSISDKGHGYATNVAVFSFSFSFFFFWWLFLRDLDDVVISNQFILLISSFYGAPEVQY